MSRMFNIQIRNLDKMRNFLAAIPPEAVRNAIHDVGIWLLGDNTRGLMAPPEQRYVSRADAGYTTSAAQRRFFFAAGIWESDGHGGVILNRYVRTNDMPNSWQMVPTEQPAGFRMVNSADGARFVYGDSKGQNQANMMKLIGWPIALKQMMDDAPAAIKYAQERMIAFFRSKNP